MPHLDTKPSAKLIQALVARAHSVRERVPPGLGPKAASDPTDAVAQAVACARPLATLHRAEIERAAPWLLGQLSEWEQWVLRETLSLSLSPSFSLPVSPSSASHLYEPFLHAWHQGRAKRGGVFFTPQSIADYIVAEIDRTLREDFKLTSGLAADTGDERHREADASRSPCLLDPALGTGVFLLAAIDRIYKTLTSEWTLAGLDAAQQRCRWNEYVPRLLPRLIGIEILPTPCFLAKLNLAIKLAQTGYDFADPTPLNITCGDALLPNPKSEIRNPKSEIPILLGNPPYSALSTSANPWISRLVRGDDEIRGYIQAGEERLGERKTWLHDDYVKFLRLAQWHIEEAGCGVVGFVTNHGYLDNATFRLLRRELLRVFPRIRLVDLHGNRKKGETAPDGCRDENVFGLDQGVAIGLFSRPPTQARRASEGFCDSSNTPNSGARARKSSAALQTLSLALWASCCCARAPDWRFVPSRGASRPEYDAGWPLTELMPVNTSAPVTARDHFVVAFTCEELHERIEIFRDLSIPDEEIRNRWFTRTRSSRYPLGDTRGWKLAAGPPQGRGRSRLAIAHHPLPLSPVRLALHLLASRDDRLAADGNDAALARRGKIQIRSPSPLLPLSCLCLISRRQQLPTQPCTYFWIADGLALDGVIRSDNRGSESLFPLWLLNDDDDGQPSRRPNLSPALVGELGRSGSASRSAPEALFGYIYALFHSPAYRERDAEQLRTGFPRVLPPRNAELLAEMSELGWQLIGLHLLQSKEQGPEASLPPAVEKMEEIEKFRVGGYEVLRKWLQPKQRTEADPEYQQIVAVIARTLQILPQIDAAIARHGLG